MKIPRTSWITLGVMLLAGGFVRLEGQTTTTILQTNFGSLASNLPAGYANQAVIPTTTGNLIYEDTVASPNNAKLFLGADGNGNLQATSQYNNGTAAWGLYQAISNGSSYASITGSISFSFPNGFSSSFPSMTIGLTNGTFAQSTGGSTSLTQFGVNGSTGVFSFFNYGTTATLNAGDSYTVSFTVTPGSNTTSFTLTDTTSNTVVLTATGIADRVSNITPAGFLVNLSGGSTTGNPATIYISGMSLSGVSAIPEPATCAVLLSVGALGFCLWRRRHPKALRS